MPSKDPQKCSSQGILGKKDNDCSCWKLGSFDECCWFCPPRLPSFLAPLELLSHPLALQSTGFSLVPSSPRDAQRLYQHFSRHIFTSIIFTLCLFNAPLRLVTAGSTPADIRLLDNS